MSNTAATPMGKGPLAVALEAAEKLRQGIYDRVVQLKKDIATATSEAEDVDTAERIKEELRKVYTLLISFNESNIQMKQAAQKEDYVEAARLKAEREEKIAAAITALTEVEQQFAAYADQKQAGVYLEHTSSGDNEVPADLPPLPIPGEAVDHHHDDGGGGGGEYPFSFPTVNNDGGTSPSVNTVAAFATDTHGDSNLGFAQYQQSQGLPQYDDYNPSLPNVEDEELFFSWDVGTSTSPLAVDAAAGAAGGATAGAAGGATAIHGDSNLNIAQQSSSDHPLSATAMSTSTSGYEGLYGNGSGLTMAQRLQLAFTPAPAIAPDGSNIEEDPSLSDVAAPAPAPAAATSTSTKTKKWRKPNTSYKPGTEKGERLKKAVKAIVTNDESTLNEMGNTKGVYKLADEFRVGRGVLLKSLPSTHRRVRGVDATSAATHRTIANNDAHMLEILELEEGSWFAVRSGLYPREKGDVPKTCTCGDVTIRVYDMTETSIRNRLEKDEKFDAKIVNGSRKDSVPQALKGKLTVWRVIENKHKTTNAAAAAAASESTANANSDASDSDSVVMDYEQLAPAPGRSHNKRVECEWNKILHQKKGSKFGVRYVGYTGDLPKNCNDLPLYDIAQETMRKKLADLKKVDNKFDAKVLQGNAPASLKGKTTVWKVIKNDYKSESAAEVSVEVSASAETLALASVAYNDARFLEILELEEGSWFAVRSKYYPREKGGMPQTCTCGDVTIHVYDMTETGLRNRLEKDKKFDARILDSRRKESVPQALRDKVTVFRVVENKHKTTNAAATSVDASESTANIDASDSDSDVEVLAPVPGRIQSKRIEKVWNKILHQKKGSKFGVRYGRYTGDLPKNCNDLPVYDIAHETMKAKLAVLKKVDNKFDAEILRGKAPASLKGKTTVWKVIKNDYKSESAAETEAAAEVSASAEAQSTGQWSREEHQQFEKLVIIHGWGNWAKVSFSISI